jgi:hypothetical protein
VTADENGVIDDITDRTVDVNDSRAHAWIEVYVDGFGWFPMDFTSGYGNVRTALSVTQRTVRGDDGADNADDIVNESIQAETIAPETPQQTETEPLVEPQNSDENRPNTDKANSTGFVPAPLIIVIAVPMILAGGVLFLFMRRRNALRQYEKDAQNFGAVAKRTLRVLEMGGISARYAMSDTGAYYKKLSESEYAEALPTVKALIKQQYGHSAPNDEEVAAFAHNLSEIILIYYRKQSRIKRLVLKYLLNLL